MLLSTAFKSGEFGCHS